VSRRRNVIARWLSLYLTLLAPQLVYAEGYGAVTVSAIRTIYDGDSFKVDINNWPAIVGESISVRVKGVDTPELRGKCHAEKYAARAAKQYAVSMLRAGKSVELRALERDKYFRLLAEVWIDGVSLGESLIRSGHAVPYDGGKKPAWCRN